MFRQFLCRVGAHSWREWVAHTRGPCLFGQGEIHIFRKCKSCEATQHDFIPVQN